MNLYFRKLGAGLAGLLRFNGRTALHDFWPYGFTMGAIVYAVGAMVSYIASFDFTFRFNQLLIERQGGWPYPSASEIDREWINQLPTEMFDLARTLMLYSLIVFAVGAALLAAAIIRRLHDTGRTGFWILLPLPFGAYATYAIYGLFSKLPVFFEIEPQQAAVFIFLSEFALAFISAMLWLAALIVLIILLCGRGTPGPNRFGPPPVPIQAARLHPG